MAGDEQPAAVVPAVEMRCANCGAPWTMRGFNTTRTLACQHCGSVMDTSVDPWRVVQKVEGAYQARPRFPLGSRATLEGTPWELIGWCERSVRVEGTRYAWEEHLLYNPYEGFRFLVHQDGHWNFITPLPGVPDEGFGRATYEGRSYRHFTSGKASVDEVLGEFPWEMKRGDSADTADYVDPPYMLSRETTGSEVVWSRGQYLEAGVVQAAFGKAPRDARAPRGVYPSQPNPDEPLLAWMLKLSAVALLAWALLSLVYVGSRKDVLVWAGTVPPEGTAPIEVQIQRGNTLELDGRIPVDNSWAFVNAMLVGPIPTEEARFAGVEVSYYHGVEDGESWSEGSQHDSTTFAGVPPGRYVLQLSQDPSQPWKGEASITLREDVPLFRFPGCSLLLIVIVPALVLLRSRGFETRRWAESDHAPSS
jgi:hypothetical protein